MTDLQKYLDKTGQSFQELMSGALQVGPDYVTEYLVPKALKEGKIIKWVPKDETLGTGTYKLVEEIKR